MKLAGLDEWDNLSMVVCPEFDYISVVEVGDWHIEDGKIMSVRTTCPFKPNKTGIIYPYEDIAEDYATALSRLYDYFPELKGCPTVFHEDTIIDKIKHHEGFAELFGQYTDEQLIFKYRAIGNGGKITETENTRKWFLSA
jgi:hypothetical protein